MSYKNFKSDKAIVLKRCQNGSYFYGKAAYGEGYSIESAKAVAKYIARYASHPAISERRILSRDKEKRTVTRFYDPHEDDLKEENEKIGRQTITDHVYDFIKRLIIHIPDKGFTTIRYYGFYSNKFKKKDSLFNKLFSTKDIDKMILNLERKHGLLYAFGYNPLICECGAEMIYNYKKSYFPKKYEGENSS